VPITFVERERGQSKMTPDIALESLRRITRWGLRERRGQAAGVVSTAWSKTRGRGGR
jgi:dolichol-phosphate mannosyltransferase